METTNVTCVDGILPEASTVVPDSTLMILLSKHGPLWSKVNQMSDYFDKALQFGNDIISLHPPSVINNDEEIHNPQFLGRVTHYKLIGRLIIPSSLKIILQTLM